MSSRDALSTAPRAQTLQDAYLAEVRGQGVPVVIYLVNGFQLRGLVKGFDSFTIVLEYEHRAHLIYKHAVSTISPQAPLGAVPGLDGERDRAAR
jgi:host factor-I protein